LAVTKFSVNKLTSSDLTLTAATGQKVLQPMSPYSRISQLVHTLARCLVGTATIVTASSIVQAVERLGPSSHKTGLVISEIMYHPAERSDALEGEFIEIYNTNPAEEIIGGFRLSGEVDYTFPANTRIPGYGYLIIAAKATD